MSNPPRHKRQKLSLLNIGYYFSDSSVNSTPQQPLGHLQNQNLHHHSSPQIEETIYDNDEDPYNPLSYNFPPNLHTSTSSSATANPQRSPRSPIRIKTEPPNYQPQPSLFYPNTVYNAPVELQYPNPYLENSLYQTFNYPRQPPPPPAVNSNLRHAKNNLSISSHFNLFNLNDQNQEKRFGTSLPSLPPPQTFSELINALRTVDGSNINNYLLSVLFKLTSPLPIDDFYNLLYNNDKQPLVVVNNPSKIDQTAVSTTAPNSSLDTINQLLNVFKNPNTLVSYFPSMANSENKLSNINYHELLRTFLAIKILFDVLIQLPSNSAQDPQNYTIPRLSIYKTYYIVCQKLILQYPSSSNTNQEQQKLILGQSKLGKLIKLVYPNLQIKRLGSRGESKYNYLGVIWNENIVNSEIKKLCNNHELVDLNEVFYSQLKLQQQQQPHHHHHHHHHKRKPSKVSVTRKNKPFGDESILSPELSFITSSNKFPVTPDFTILTITTDSKPSPNWFDLAKYKLYAKFNQHNIDYATISDIFLNNENLLSKESLLNKLIDRLINPLVNISSVNQGENLDMSLYLVIIIELLPYLLLIKSSTEINFLKNLRVNLLYLINNLNGELSNIDNNEVFSHKNSSIFLLTLKKLINLNDLLITFIKLTIKGTQDNRSAMAADIETFFFDDKQESRNSSISDEHLNRSSSVSSAASEVVQDPFNMNFKSILSNDLIYTLIGYNFDPTMNDELKSSISMSFINQESSLIDSFFKQDLLEFLNDHESEYTDPVLSEDMPKELLSAKEYKKLYSLIHLIDTKLLTENFKSKYPVLVFNNYINFILNDLLKYIFLKQQQQLQQTQLQDKYSFGNWWVFNSFVQEYLSLLGEIVGLNDLV